MKKTLVVAALCLVWVAPCLAQQAQDNQPASAADIERYFQVMHIRDQMKDMMTAMSAQMRQIMHEQLQKNPNLPPDAQQQMDKMLQKLPTEEILQAMVPVYQKYLTKGDVNSLIAFYSSPTGQKMLSEMPQITKDGMQAESGIMRQYMEDTMKEVQAQIAQMQKNEAAQRKAAVSKE